MPEAMDVRNRRLSRAWDPENIALWRFGVAILALRPAHRAGCPDAVPSMAGNAAILTGFGSRSGMR